MAKTPKHILNLRKEIDNLVPKLRPLTEHQSMQLAMQTSRASWNDCKMHKHIVYGCCGNYGEVMRRVTTEYTYATVIDRCKDWNVVRYFQFYHQYYKTKSNVHHEPMEVAQYWIAPDGTMIVREKALAMFHYNRRNPYSNWSDLRFKQKDSGYALWEKVLMVRSMTPELRRRGFNARRSDKLPEAVISLLLSSNYAETLWKRKDFKAFDFLYSKREKAQNIEVFSTAHKIAHRNHYTIEDYGLWWDMIAAWHALGKDIHSPHYVCPKDFMMWHDRAMNQLARHKDAIELAKMISESAGYEAEYHKRVEKLMPIVPVYKDKFAVFVCPSVAKMAEEGQKMHHCVFRMGYYKKENNCLILLVRGSGEGEDRISTMELSTKTWTIVQNRGVSNTKPKFDKEARKLVMDNIDRYKDAFKNAGKKQKAKVISINQPLTQAA